jgi:hypothetical protein
VGATKQRPANFQREDRYSNLPRAFMRGDITFLTRRKAPLDTNKLLAMIDDDALVQIGQLSSPGTPRRTDTGTK